MMKKIFKKIIFRILIWEAQLVLWRYRPKIIAITGTVGKTATKDAIYCALSCVFHVRKNHKSFNSEIGVPLTILGLESGWNSPFVWLKNIFIGLIQIVYRPNYPKWLILETGVDQPGDMKKTASWLHPTVAVITAFSKVPVHVENFESPEEVMQEKASLMNYIQPDGVLILNHDDEDVLRLKGKSKNKVYTYGIDGGDLVASNYLIKYQNGQARGISFKINYANSTIPISIADVVGEQFIYPILGALSVGVSVGVSFVDMATALNNLKFAPGRMNLLEGQNGALLIDDTYNSSPIAVTKAIETLSKIKARGLKIAILGDMLEIGHFSVSEHKKVGSLIVEKGIDVLISVGVRSESTAEQAIQDGLKKDKVFYFKNSQDAIETALGFCAEGNVILIKGSQGVRMEKITKELLSEENKKRSSDILVRQESVWSQK